MKKPAYLIIVLVMACLLSACNFTTNFSDTTGNSQMQARNEVEAMMTALAEGDDEAALALMHPDATENAAASIDRLQEFLAGRKVAQMAQISLQVKVVQNKQGKTRQEKGSFQVQLEDGTPIYLSVQYVEEEQKEGFASFQIVLAIP